MGYLWDTYNLIKSKSEKDVQIKQDNYSNNKDNQTKKKKTSIEGIERVKVSTPKTSQTVKYQIEEVRRELTKRPKDGELKSKLKILEAEYQYYLTEEKAKREQKVQEK